MEINSSLLPSTTISSSSNTSNIQHTWNKCNYNNFILRSGLNYIKNQLKSPSPPSILSLIGVDIIRCENRIDNIYNYINLNWLNNYKNIEINNYIIPTLFIFNIQVSFYSYFLYLFVDLLIIYSLFFTFLFLFLFNSSSLSILLISILILYFLSIIISILYSLTRPTYSLLLIILILIRFQKILQLHFLLQLMMVPVGH